MTDRKGRIILIVPSMQMLEVISEAPSLDLGFAVRLNMEGEQTGRHVTYRPSRLFREERAA